MITLKYDRLLNISDGANRKSTDWRPCPIMASAVYSKCETPIRGTETVAEYLSLPKIEQDERKDIGGFVGGRLNGSRRKAGNVVDRCIVTLDFDTVPPYGTQKILDVLDALECGYCVYSTRKHRPEVPRLRVLLVTDREMSVDEYDAVSRRLAADIGITMADPTTFEAHRLMYWPSCSADGEYIFRYKDAPFVSVDTVLSRYTDWHNWAERPQVPGASNYQKLAVRQGDPEEKPGIIGAFCRVYDVYRAMDKFLPGLYEPVDNDPNRYTYLNGSTTGGAIIYDNGKFLYSHHATDPCGGKLVNAADLVRLHKFGHLDDNTALDTPINRVPSFKAFVEFAAADTEVSTLMIRERYEAGQNEFTGVVSEDTETDNASDNESTGGACEVDPIAWMVNLQVTQQGAIKQTIDNIRIILDNDPRLKGRFALNQFAGFVEVQDELPWPNRGINRRWNDTDTSGLYWYMEKRYDITKRVNIDAAFALCVDQHSFNRVKDYITGLVWDGLPRLDTVFVDYLGATDDSYTKAVTRKAFTAAIARAMEPGCKYDNMLILCGPQGIGKSTLLDKMSCGWFNDSIRTFEGKEASELLQGVWIAEIAELDAFRRTDVARIKQFLSLRADRYRAAYGRNVQELPRRCVFFGTCNERDFLQDETGNRRFWPVDVGMQPKTKDVWHDLPREIIDQIWAEAKARWQTGEQLYLTGDIEKLAQERQEQHRDASPQEGLIAEFLSKPIPVDWQTWPIDRRRDWWAQTTHGDIKTVEREYISVIEIWCELFNRSQSDLTKTNPQAREIRGIIRKLKWIDTASRYCGCSYGKQRTFRKCL